MHDVSSRRFVRVWKWNFPECATETFTMATVAINTPVFLLSSQNCNCNDRDANLFFEITERSGFGEHTVVWNQLATFEMKNNDGVKTEKSLTHTKSVLSKLKTVLN